MVCSEMRIEVNMTLRCNLACPNCNRLCHIFRDRTDDMSKDQIQNLINDVIDYRDRTGKKINRIKVVGGEPFMHPDYAWILNKLGKLVSGYCSKVKVDTNGTVKFQTDANVVISGRAPKRKIHLPYLWSPQDLGLTVTPCRQPIVCGFSVDNKGWLPCSAAIMIARCFGLTHLYKDKMPTKVWGMDELCRHCIHAAPEDFRKQMCKPLNQITENEKTPTSSWREALENYVR